MIGASVVLYNTSFEDVSTVVNSTVMAMAVEDTLYLIDNSELENQRARDLSDKYHSVVYIYNGANLGYGAAHNVAMRRALQDGKQFHVIINPDVSFKQDTFRLLAGLMHKEPSLGHVMPKIIYPDGGMQYLCKLLPRPSDLFMRRFLPFKRVREFLGQGYELRAYDYYSRMDCVPALSGCFMFLRLEVVEKAGFFDEKIFMYMEDFDLTRRLLMESDNCYYPGAEVVHAYDKGSYSNPRLLKCHLKSAFYYFFKWGWFFDGARSKVNSDFHKKNRF